MATGKFNVGDHVVIESSNVEFIAKFAGKTGVIKKYFEWASGYHYLVEIDNCPGLEIWCKVKCLVEEKKEEKIVITHDGKTTTATKYCEDGSKVTATARCAPDDEFDFNVGAKLAMERLMEKVNPPIVHYIGGFKVGDRVNFNGINGTVICLAATGANRIGVQFDEKTDICHRCEGIPLIAGAIGNKNTCRWMFGHDIKHGEAPKYYNGKVVCVDAGRIPEDLTVGKVYTFVDGRCKNDLGGQITNSPAKDFDDLQRRFITVKFIPLAE